MPQKSRIAAAGLLALLAALTIVLQSYNVGFWSYSHGWTSVHGMALMSRTEPQNDFVGYSMMYRQADGSPTYEYFERYPPFFSISVNALLALTDDLPTEIYIARLYMNIFFIGALWVGYRLARLFIEARLLAVAAVALAFSSYYLLYYRDMIDYYQPVMLSFLIMAYSIARYRRGGGRWQVILWAGALTLVSFGYAMLFILGVWFLVEAVEAFTRQAGLLRARFWRAVFGLPAAAIALSLGLTVASIGYNVTVEAAALGIPVTETSIVDSILRRLPFVEGAVTETARAQAATAQGVRGWLAFWTVETERLMKWSLPLKTGGETGVRFVPGVSDIQLAWTPAPLRAEGSINTTPPEVWLNGWLLLGAVAAFGWLVRFIVRQPGQQRGTAVIIAFGGFPLVFGLINLTSVHDYTLMFAVGFNVMLWVALLAPLDGRRGPGPLLALAGVGLFALSAWMVRQDKLAEIEQGAPYTYDFNRMRQDLPADARQTVYLNIPRANPECVVRDWQCFALGYYLGDNFLTNTAGVADYALSFVPYAMRDLFVPPGETTEIVARPLQPENERLYLLDLDAAEPRTAPTEPNATFGEVLTLGAWVFAGDVQVRPCERVWVESWWTANTTTNYNLQLVLLDANNASISEANAPLGTVPTGIWEPGRYTFDARSLVIPCGTPPGEYPLIMGAYDPATLMPLAVTAPDGAPLGNQLYLTTLFVSGGAS